MSITPWHYHSQTQLLLPLLLIALAAATRLVVLGAAAEKQGQPITLPGCPDKCGDISLPFPFGLAAMPGCFLEGFEVSCNDSFDPPRAFLAYPGLSQSVTRYSYIYSGAANITGRVRDMNITVVVAPFELIGVSSAKGEVQVYGAVASVCSTNADNFVKTRQATYLVDTLSINGEGPSPFLLSMTRNVLVGIGWDVDAMVSSSIGGKVGNSYFLTCESDLRGNLHDATNGSCSRRGCCQPSFPEAAPLDRFSVNVDGPYNNTLWETNPCSYAMVVESSWYNFSTPDLYGDELQRKILPRGVPYVLDFAIRSGSCPPEGQPSPVCASADSYCANATRGPGFVCKCLPHYEGNPYITGGCKDIDECEHPDLYPCSGTCINKPGGYDCPCQRGEKGDGKTGTCADKFPLLLTVVVGAIGGISFISIVTLVILLRKEKIKMREFYEKNGGPTLQKAKIIKLFKKEELKPILKSRNFIGKGGFGEVYKGRLLDIGLVAVKKPISGSVLENNQFANEVIIQSQVIHKNIVRLIGCCLEVDIPMLVYEFLSRGSLDDILHNNNVAPLDLDVRLHIAAEVADALAYMHSKAHTRILHGDVKPANILLDDDFMPKISDFGISRLIVRDRQHTNTVIGDRSYMDPEYLRSGLLTEKSDVYSFGVVILELISRQQATHLDGSGLVDNFLAAHKENRVAALFDNAFTRPRDLELLGNLAGIAIQCLEDDVNQRPSMVEVAERILAIYQSHITLI
ncbi:hypothetical protein CFC21_095587 [Triticum aestivum]|uniref:Protein kinase domain-containing protein n=2 Tax=Triticum aestivum TaxID=4565 RepID=A0A3B6RBU1_WHEAT|nr:wall-associated receptor kinase 4-like [Triticum aestivum]KAF7093159.1 hypothetical protein CFC21_095587 [Triticum aestivum]